MAQANNPRKVSCKNHIFHQFIKVFFLESFALYGMTLNVLLSVRYLLVLACNSSNKIIEGSCVNSADIMTSICVLECTWQFECYKYTLYIVMQYAKGSSQIAKLQAHS